MQTNILYAFESYSEYAIIISIFANIIIAVLGIIPSFFITGANILFFGFWQGGIISFTGEALGAIISFLLYRKGFKKISSDVIDKHPKLQKLIYLEGRKAFYTVISLRLMPFVPSGLITFAAAVGKMDAIRFTIASSLGKVPALWMEAYSVYHVTSFTWQGKVILLVIGLIILFRILRSSY